MRLHLCHDCTIENFWRSVLTRFSIPRHQNNSKLYFHFLPFYFQKALVSMLLEQKVFRIERTCKTSNKTQNRHAILSHPRLSCRKHVDLQKTRQSVHLLVPSWVKLKLTDVINTSYFKIALCTTILLTNRRINITRLSHNNEGWFSISRILTCIYVGIKY